MRKTIYINDEAAAVIGRAANVSGRIETVLTRYRHIIDEATPELPLEGWLDIAEALHPFLEARDLPLKLIRTIAPGSALADYFLQFNFAAYCAVVETVTRYWELKDAPRPEGVTVSDAILLQTAGARLCYPELKEEIITDDPAPYCGQCMAKTKKACTCGPIADNE